MTPRTPSYKLRVLLQAELVEREKEKEKLVPVLTLVDDDAGDKMEKKPETISWRELPCSDRECIIIISIGDYLTPSSVDVVPKLRDTSTTESGLLKRELEAVQKKMRQDSGIKIVHACILRHT